MMWIPPWLARAYARLYAAKKTEQFQFSEAGDILGTRDERPLAKILAKLKSFGHLTVRRDPADPRRKLFRLIDPESIVLAFAVQSRAENNDVAGKLRAASHSLNYYVSGAYAAYQYHRHTAAQRVDIYVRPENLPMWIAFLSGPKVAISIDDVPAEKPADENVYIRSDFDQNLAENVRTIDGIRYLSPAILIILGIAKEDIRLDDVLAMLVVQRTRLDWKGVIELSEAYNATRFLGCILDVLNFESRKLLFEKSVIARLFKRSNLDAPLDFPQSLSKLPQEGMYAEISSKWNLRLHLTHAQVSKVVTDLVRS